MFRRSAAWLMLVGALLASPVGIAALHAQQRDEPAILAALDAFLDGWNSRDARKYASALHFPHLILEAGGFRQWESEEKLIAVGAGHWANVQPEWEKTVWEEKKIVQRIGDTAHVAGRWVRLDKSGLVLQKADVLYVVLRRNGKWAIFARSGSRAIARLLICSVEECVSGVETRHSPGADRVDRGGGTVVAVRRRLDRRSADAGW